MVQIVYVEFVGVEHAVEVKPGMTAMEGAVKNNIPGIDADCGGACACATCHVYVDPTWMAAVGAPSKMESNMLEFANGSQSNSRLACQIKVTAALDGLMLRMPKSQ